MNLEKMTQLNATLKKILDKLSNLTTWLSRFIIMETRLLKRKRNITILLIVGDKKLTAVFPAVSHSFYLTIRNSKNLENNNTDLPIG